MQSAWAAVCLIQSDGATQLTSHCTLLQHAGDDCHACSDNDVHPDRPLLSSQSAARKLELDAALLMSSRVRRTNNEKR